MLLETVDLKKKYIDHYELNNNLNPFSANPYSDIITGFIFKTSLFFSRWHR